MKGFPSDDSAVPAFWQGLGLPGLIDAHVHFMPPRLLARVWEYFAAAGPLIGHDWPIRYRWAEEKRLGHLRDLGVRAFTSLAYPHKPGMAEALNEWTLEFVERTPGCVPSATLYPEPEAKDYVADALERGARVFKVHVQVGGFDPREQVLDPVWGMLADARVPVVIHAGSGPVATAFTGPEPLAGVLRRHPTLTAVVAHLGGPEFEGFFALADCYERVHLDTTMAFTSFFARMGVFPDRLLPHLRDLGLGGRILLGSDFPNIPYPYAEQLAGLAELGFGDEWLREVCWYAPERLGITSG